MAVVSFPDVVIRQRSQRAENDILLHLVDLLLRGLGVPNAVQKRGVRGVSNAKLLIEGVLNGVQWMKGVVTDDRRCGGHTTIHCLQGLLLTFVSGKDDDRSKVEAIKGGRHLLQGMGGDH